MGLAIKIPMAPVVRPAKILYLSEGFSSWSFGTILSLTESYKPIRSEQKTIYLQSPEDKPLNKA